MADEQITDVIEKFAGEGKTGTVMAVFSDNSLGRFHLVSGVLATARYRNREGQEAIDAAKLLAVTTAKFHENADLVRSGKLIDADQNAEIIRQPSPAQQLPPGRQAGPQLTHAMRAGIGELLAEYIGPVAPLVMADLPEVVNVETAIDQVSKEISDAQMVSNFVAAARRIAAR